MSEPFIGEIRTTAFGFAPKGWALCNGQLLPINQNQALFSLLGTMYGGDGRVNFALPDLRGRAPMHVSPTHAQGEQGGEEYHTLTAAELPAHRHHLLGTQKVANSPLPAGAHPAASAVGGPSIFGPPTALRELRPEAVGLSGGGQPHNNLAPLLTLSFIIALQGIFPSRS